jgi:hypothetical protein
MSGGTEGMDNIEVVNLEVSTLDESDLFISTPQLLIQRHAPHRCMTHVSGSIRGKVANVFVVA